MIEISTKYNAKDVEAKWYRFWEEKNYFHAEVNPKGKKTSYSIVIPPPNITGILHMGHALNNTLQDILIRYNRMQGYETEWMPGTDHAGIATQNVVEKELAKEGVKRDDLGRDRFLDRVWKWREQYGSTIIKQLKELGCSCDWDRLRFTMDKDYSKAVNSVFIALWSKKPKGLIYQDYKVINWCPRCQTALSDEEAPRYEIQGKLYYIKYPVKDSPKEFVTVATTRPETMLGDTAVAVNPKDKRYKKNVGKILILPLMNREIKVISDEMVDIKFGTGAVKVTPAHDPNDYILGKKHNLDFINILYPNACLNENTGSYKNMDRFEARRVVINDLEERGLIEKIEQHQISAGHCYRCHTVIEPYLSKQWFVKMKPLAKPAIEAVKKGEIKFYPKRWTKVYLDWMENIQDWCISRQIWWGHRIPIYYCNKCQETGIPDSTREGIIVSERKPEKCPFCGSPEIYQEEDVLDTWFSSWLWPFATFGWPEKTPELKYFYPTNCLVTAQEIIFFWVARMIMAGLEFMHEIPFRHVYIHGTVRDNTGKKMSKSLGNIIDPLDIINEFGCDALRFSVISITSTGQDVFLSKEKFELGRNFANKIWNASKFVLTNAKGVDSKCLVSDVPKQRVSNVEFRVSSLADTWILSRLNQTIAEVTKYLGKYRFNDAANILYAFFWHEFCDWYLELVKPILVGSQQSTVDIKNKNLLTMDQGVSTQTVLSHVLEVFLRLLHPFMPFISEEIWQLLKSTEVRGPFDYAQGKQKTEVGKNPNLFDSIAAESIMVAPWPEVNEKVINKKLDNEMGIIIDIITSIRNIRTEMNIPLSKRPDVILSVSTPKDERLLNEAAPYIENLARVGKVEVGKNLEKPESSAVGIVKDIEIFIPLKDLIALGVEKKRLEKQIENIKNELNNLAGKLGNKDFLKKAPQEIVSKEKLKKEELTTTLGRLENNLKNLQ